MLHTYGSCDVPRECRKCAGRSSASCSRCPCVADVRRSLGRNWRCAIWVYNLTWIGRLDTFLSPPSAHNHIRLSYSQPEQMIDVEKGLADDSSLAPPPSSSTMLDGPVPFPSMTTLTLSTSSTPTEVASAPAPKSTRPRPCPRESSRQGVLSAIGAFLALLCTFGQMNAFGAFLAYYKDHQLASYSSAVISWIGSIQLFVFFVSVCSCYCNYYSRMFLISPSQGIPVGILFDKYGPRLPIVLGSVIHVLSMVLTSVSTKYWHLVLTHGFLFGLGVALV